MLKFNWNKKGNHHHYVNKDTDAEVISYTQEEVTLHQKGKNTPPGNYGSFVRVFQDCQNSLQPRYLHHPLLDKIYIA